MANVKSFRFDIDGIDEIKSTEHGRDWPVVYVINGNKEVYVGETVKASKRTKDHLDNPARNSLDEIHIISDNDFNKSATLDIESSLISLFAGDGKLKLQNSNSGLVNHNYYEREKYISKIKEIWEDLKDIGIVVNDIPTIENSDLFKYSPYKALNDEQLMIANGIKNDIINNEKMSFLVKGSAGTGKTVLATYLVKYLSECENTNHYKIGLVVPMTSLRKTLRRVFKSAAGLTPGMVIGPSDVVKEKYDILIVDESHRLKQRKNLTNYSSFDNTNKELGLGEDGTEFDWIMKSSKYQILFYDNNQSIKPTDVSNSAFDSTAFKEVYLTSQMRVKAGTDYISYIDMIFSNKKVGKKEFHNYDLRFYKDISAMVYDIKLKNEHHELCRIVAGYAWEWNTKDSNSKGRKSIKHEKAAYDIEIDGLKLIWNSTNEDWVNSDNAINEVGCIHTVQGYDLNYVGVIIGHELGYDKTTGKIVAYNDKYMDKKGKISKELFDEETFYRYISNIYGVLLTRGILGTYIYVCDEELREYLEKLF